MKAQFTTTKPDEIEFSMTVTMTLGAWRKLRGQLDPLWPACDFRQAISDMIQQAEEKFYPKPDEQANQ